MATVSEWVAVVLALAFVAISGRNVTSFAAPAVFGFLVLVFAFEGGALSRALRGGIFQALGDLSYSIYIVHALVVLLFTSMSSLLLSHSMVAVWRVETYDGINERILNVTGQGVSDLLTVGYVAVVLVLAVIGWRLVEKPSRTAVNAWAQARPQPQGIPA